MLMTRNKAYDLRHQKFSSNDTLLLDANIWLYLFPAPSGRKSKFAAHYSNAFKKMKASKAQLVVDPLILSEYVNRYCRIEWNALHAKNYPNFKKFRVSEDFQSLGETVAEFAGNILRVAERRNHPFDKVDINQVLMDFKEGGVDLNDGLLAETCRIHGWKFVTNDGDFKKGGIEVLTTNPRLLAACS
jgi:predicted nucleic acid-binding protein